MILDQHPNKETYQKAIEALREAGFQVDPGAKTRGMIQSMVKRNASICAQLIIMEKPDGMYAFRGGSIAKGMADSQAKQFAQKVSSIQDEALRSRLQEQGTDAFLYWPQDSLIFAMIGGSPGDINKTVEDWLTVVETLKPVLG